MTAFERSLSTFRRTIAKLASNQGSLAAVTRAENRAYNLARLEADPNAAYDAIVAIKRTVELADETARAARIAYHQAESTRIRDEIRDNDRHGPTAWMRYGT